MSDRGLSGLHIQPSREVMLEGSSNGIIMTVVTGLATVVALITISHYVLEHYSPNFGYRLFSSKWELLLSQVSAVDVLVLGDSSANQAIDTEYIMATTDLTALNLATLGDAIAVNDHWMLEEYIDRVGPPDCVVVGHVYDVWKRSIHYPLVARVPVDGSSIRNRLSELRSNQIDKLKVQLNFLIAKYLRAFSENRSMTRLLMYPWTAQKTSPIKLLNSGFYAVHDAQPEDVANDANGHLKLVRSKMFEPSHDNQYSLTRMVDLADKHKFRLYFINSPLYQGVYEDEYFRRYLSNVNAFISNVTNQSDFVTHLFSIPITYGAHEMQNVDHLVATAAEHFTQEVIENIECVAPAAN